ncbi:hypothetical protein N7454_003010 [Penicillium verhagenii]|nr:hypothetical protein N7454_003010 [Penicillium verhagenii]
MESENAQEASLEGDEHPTPVVELPLNAPDMQNTNDSTSDFAKPAVKRQFAYPVMSDALSALIEGNITVVEWGSQIQYRCGYAEVLIRVEWAVPDEQLSVASQILIDHGFPLLEHGWNQLVLGMWGTGCLPHDLDGAGHKKVHLLPLSLVGLTLEETIEVPSTFDPELTLRSPKPPRYFLSLFRHLLQLPLADCSRTRVQQDICTFILGSVIHSLPADTPRWIVDAESEEDYQKRVEQGVLEMKSWDWGEVEPRYLEMAERAVRDCHYTKTLTNVVDDEDDDGSSTPKIHRFPFPWDFM